MRQQLIVYKRTVTRPRLRKTDRLFWVWLARLWVGWRRPLVIVTPNTVPRWQRRRFREHWTKLSGQPTGGRPRVNAAIKALVTRMAAANPLWGAPRIHGELLKLGIDVGERTVSRLLPKRRTPPSQTTARPEHGMSFRTLRASDLPGVLHLLECRADGRPARGRVVGWRRGDVVRVLTARRRCRRDPET
ncbi:MAG: hypothetical protein ACREK6_00600 [Candidatus Rokuibacteriota bacterium]